nr:RecName: Full=Mitotic-spindle organizing protein 1; AltName: Full=Mitotic-spindle organizing protein associated with a ring of gamma-tubulin 1 [Drosophila willistoni]
MPEQQNLRKTPSSSGKNTEKVLDVAAEMSMVMNIGLPREALEICFKLLDAGIDPEALGKVVKRLMKEEKNLGLIITEID